ncbi:hypothetical protein GOC15_22770 [Sinorhizobium meliloti]|nr:hypothetical protein [Sinorhizobium meliloti]
MVDVIGLFYTLWGARQYAIGAVGGVLLFSAVNALLWLPQARDEGRATLIAEQAAANRKAELERKNDDAKLRGMSDYDLCVDGLRSRGLSIDPCNELRGVRAE